MTKILKYKYNTGIDSYNIKNIYLSNNNFIYFNTRFGPKSFYMPNFFLKKVEKNRIKLIFDNYNKYNLFFRQLIRIFAHSFRIFFFKLKLRKQ